VNDGQLVIATGLLVLRNRLLGECAHALGRRLTNECGWQLSIMAICHSSPRDLAELETWPNSGVPQQSAIATYRRPSLPIATRPHHPQSSPSSPVRSPAVFKSTRHPEPSPRSDARHQGTDCAAGCGHGTGL
jgi:hypothetical protein